MNNDVSISSALIEIIRQSISRYGGDTDSGLCIHFNDPGYSAETGGFHPVEIGLDATGKLLYITDFVYVGRQPFVELVKDLDFDFQHRVVQQEGRDYQLSKGAALYGLWERNFIAYIMMNIYQISLTQL